YTGMSFFRFIVLSLLAAIPIVAQPSAALSGSVTDPSGSAVTGAAIALVSADTGAIRKAVTDNAGLYRFPALPIGRYEVHAVKSGFRDGVRTGIELAVNESAAADIRLEIGKASLAITVNADAAMVSLDNTASSGLVGEREIGELPLNGRSFDELMLLNPGVVNFTSMKTGGVGVSNSTSGNNFVVAGNRPQQNLYLLNGIEFTGAAENNMQPGGVSQQLLGVDAVREFNLLTDSYSAEYGKHPGAQVVIVTRAGTNQLHGSLYEFLRNNDLDSRNFFDGASVPGFARNQFGASIGGPIRKNKTFAFGNFEQLLQHLHQTGVDLVPDNNARAGYLPCGLVTPTPANCAKGLSFIGVSPLIDSWPTPTPGAPDFGGIGEALNNPLQTIRDTFGTIRFDQVFSNADSLNAVYTVDDSRAFTPT